MAELSDPRAGGATPVADLLNYLFASRLSARGKPYTLKEVSDATGGLFSIAYLSLLRRGGIVRPSPERLRALAAFFNVESSYFLGKDPTCNRSPGVGGARRPGAGERRGSVHVPSSQAATRG